MPGSAKPAIARPADTWSRAALSAAIALAWVLGQGSPAAAEPQKVAFFGILMIDTSLGQISPEEEARRQAMEARIIEAMGASERYVLVDTAPVAERAQLFANLSHCNGCDTEFARSLGADIAMSGEIQKTSNLILSISIYMRDAQTDQLIGGGSADIRGNTDQSWARGINYILKNRILRP